MCAHAQVHVIRLLRARAERPAVKAGKALAEVSLTELLVAFNGMSIATPDAMTRLLREE